VRIENLSLNLGEFKLRNVSLEIQKGEYIGLLGPTGCGKTSLLKCIAGIHNPLKGRIWLNGEEVTHWPPEKRKVGYVPQDYKLFPHLTVEENIAFGLRNRAFSADWVKELMELVGVSRISKKRCVKNLSGGEKQRVALARALAIRPKLLLLDEPLGAVDSVTNLKLRKEIKRIHDQTKATTIHVTHDFEEIVGLADKVAIMQDGRIVEFEEPRKLLKRTRSKFLAEFIRARA